MSAQLSVFTEGKCSPQQGRMLQKLCVLLSAALQALQAAPAVSLSLMLMMLSPWSAASPAAWWQQEEEEVADFEYDFGGVLSYGMYF